MCFFVVVLHAIGGFSSLGVTTDVLLFLVTVLTTIVTGSPVTPLCRNFLLRRLRLHVKSFGLFSRNNRPLGVVRFVGSYLVAIFFLTIKLRVGQRLLINRLSSFHGTSLPFMTTYNNVLIPIVICSLLIIRNAPRAHNVTVPVTASVTFSLNMLDLLNGQIPLDLGVFLATFTIISSVNNVLIVTVFCDSRITCKCLVMTTILCFFLCCVKGFNVARGVFFLLVKMVV